MGPATFSTDPSDNGILADQRADDGTGRSVGRELAGGFGVLVALFIALCLVLGEDSARHVGPFGESLRGVLIFLFGKVMSFLVPVGIGFAAIRFMLNRSMRVPWGEMLGAALIVVSLCGFLALPTADEIEMRQTTFARAGAIGAFMVDWEGIGLVGAFGTIGAAFALGGMLFAGSVLTTGFGLTWAGERVVGWLRRRESSRPSPSFAGLPEETEAAPMKPQRASATGPVSLQAEPPAPRRASTVPADSDEPPMGAFGFDSDAEAALRAIEAAEMDREFEIALQRELAGAEDTHQEFPEATASPAPHSCGARNVGSAEARERVSRLFAGQTPPREAALPRRVDVAPLPLPPESELEGATGDPEFDALMARAAVAASRPVASAPTQRQVHQEVQESREDDPLFDDSIETRPRGPLAADTEATRSAAPPPAPKRPEPLEVRLPEVQLLDDPPRVDNRMPREEMLEISQVLEKTFADFGIAAKVVDVKQGPVVTRFELKPAAGVKVSRIASLDSDLAMALKAVSVRILAPIPGKAVVGIEVPNRNRQGVYLKELICCAEFWEQASPLSFALGKTIEGGPYFCDLRKMPHLLIAGATGAGKSVCLNTIISSILYRMRPDQVRLIMVDPKRVELSIYDGIPHLIAPVVCEPKRAAAALAWAVELMEDRYKKLVEFNVRNIDGYNAIVENPKNFPKAAGKSLDPMPYVVVIVDELADLMITAKAEVEESIQRLAQMARAVGIHLILATQRPSVNVITGIIKANFPSRIAFQVSQKVDSRTILDQNGAEALLGRGDMLFSPGGQPKPLRVQGCFMSDQEVERIVDHWKSQSPPMYDIEEFEPVLSEKERRELAKMMGDPSGFDDLDAQDVLVNGSSRGTNRVMGKVHAGMFVPHSGGSAQAGDDEIDEALVRAAARTILEGRKGSTSLVQRRLKVGFARAGRLMDMLEEMGIVGPYKGSKPRDILVDCGAALAQLDELEGRDGTARAMAADDEELEE